ncbi:MAG: S41 family peptidase [Gammaproteobacteria bacterium]|nr:S41 family peptidase [Gammaproteobacteria bacterium]
MTLRPITLVGIVISMVTGIAMGIAGYRAWLVDDTEAQHARAFDEVLSHVHDSYVSEVEKQVLVDSALKGMLHDLDSHSDFLNINDYRNLQAETTGQFGGIGIELGLVDEYFTVISPLDDTPASQAGLSAGDRITQINDEPLQGKKLIDVVAMLRGEPGSSLDLLIRRADESPRTVPLTRQVIEVASVRGELLEPGYGYIRISQFQTATSDDFAQVLADLKDDAGGNLRGIVLDLRNNPGGVLQASVAVADTFLTEGMIVSTRGRLPSSHLKYRASGDDRLDGAPIVVMINGGSASAAEIVAGALQDHDRAILLGTTSYGKGSVQSVMPLSGDRAVKLTTALYYTPHGRSINNTGIEPDVEFDADAHQPAAEDADPMLAEALALLKAEQTTGLHAKL